MSTNFNTAYHMIMNNLVDRCNSGADPGFFKPGGLAGILGLPNQWGTLPKFENFNIENCYTGNTSNITKLKLLL